MPQPSGQSGLNSRRCARLRGLPMQVRGKSATVVKKFDSRDHQMGSLSIWHWLIVLAVGLLLFGGKNKVSSLMGDFAKGIKAFKAGMKEEDEAEASPPPAQVSPPGAAATTPAAAAAAERPHQHV